jgi:hypothetical protein
VKESEKVVKVWRERFSILKSTKIDPDAFANIRYGDEITIVIEESREGDFIEIQRGYRLLSFDMVLPFGTVGFIARISKALADEGISIFVISSYTTDHILVRDEDLAKAVRKLEEIGFIVVME